MTKSPIEIITFMANEEITDPNCYVNSEQVRAVLLGIAFQFTSLFVLEECDPESMQISIATLVDWLQLTARSPSECFHDDQ